MSARAAALEDLLPALEGLTAAGEPFSAISVGRLVAGAGMSRSRFYNNFEDKGDLLRAALERTRPELEAAVHGWWDADGPVDPEFLRQGLQGAVRCYAERRALVLAFLEAPRDWRIRAQLDEIMDARIGELAAHVSRGQKQGWADPAIGPRPTAGWLTWAAERAARQIGLAEHPPAEASAIDAYPAIVARTIYTS